MKFPRNTCATVFLSGACIASTEAFISSTEASMLPWKFLRFHRSFYGSFYRRLRGCPWKLLPRKLPWKFAEASVVQLPRKFPRKFPEASTEVYVEAYTTSAEIDPVLNFHGSYRGSCFHGSLHGDFHRYLVYIIVFHSMHVHQHNIHLLYVDGTFKNTPVTVVR